jgi:hypothetical protein
MQNHPAADLFPMMTSEELLLLTEDIAENGLREPIVTLDGKVLDGRNRLQACGNANVEPEFVEYEGSEPYTYVISVNLHRRHLTSSQIAAIAVDASEPLMEEVARRASRGRAEAAATRPRDERGKLASSAVSNETALEPKYGNRSREILANQFGTSHAQVGRAQKVRAEDPELFQQIKDGEVSVGAAYNQVKGEPKEYQSTKDSRKDTFWDDMKLLNRNMKDYMKFAGAPKEAKKRAAAARDASTSFASLSEVMEMRSETDSITFRRR